MAYLNKVKSDPASISAQGIGLKGINIGVNYNRTYGGSPYTGWYNALDVPIDAPESIVMYKANSPAEGTIFPNGVWTYDFVFTSIPFSFIDGAFTIESWVYFPTGFAPVDLCYFTVGGDVFKFSTNGSGQTLLSYGGSAVVTSSSNMTNGAWNHIALTQKDGRAFLYINGVNVGTNPFVPGPLVPDLGEVLLFKNSAGVNMYFTNLRVVTKTAIYPTESVVGGYPQYPLNRSYDDTALLILGKKASNFDKDYSINNSIPVFEGQPYLDVETPTPLKKIIDATKWDATPWNSTNVANALVNLIDGHPARFGQPYFAGVDQAVEWAFETTTQPIMFSNMCYFDTDFAVPYLKGCEVFLDSGNISSYPLVRSRHYNLKKYNDYATVSTGLASWDKDYGGRLFIQKTTPNQYGIRHDVSSLNFASFNYFGVIGLPTNATAVSDIVGFYGGNQNWRIIRTASSTLRLMITNGAGTEVGFGDFSIGGVVNNPYFALYVTYDNGVGDYRVFVNGNEVLSGTNALGRSTTPGGSLYQVGYNNNDPLYHNVTALWRNGNDDQEFLVGMGQAFAAGGRFTGIW